MVHHWFLDPCMVYTPWRRSQYKRRLVFSWGSRCYGWSARGSFFFFCCSSPTTPRIRASSAESTWNLWPGVIEHWKRDYPSDKYLVGRWIRSMDRYCVSPRLVNSVFFIFVKVKFLQGFLVFLLGGGISNRSFVQIYIYGAIYFCFFFISKNLQRLNKSYLSNFYAIF